MQPQRSCLKWVTEDFSNLKELWTGNNNLNWKISSRKITYLLHYCDITLESAYISKGHLRMCILQWILTLDSPKVFHLFKFYKVHLDECFIHLPTTCQLFLLVYPQKPDVLSDSYPTSGVAKASATWPSSMRYPATSLLKLMTWW